jgi:predicted amidohydrolase YtcJ
MYAMISVNQKNIDMYLKKGIYKTDNLDVRSFKMYGDGALGSRGACLHKSYSDTKAMGHYCLLQELRSVAQQIANSEFQLNSACYWRFCQHSFVEDI